MLDILKFLFSDFWHWLGACIMLAFVILSFCTAMGYMIGMFGLLREQKKKPNVITN